MKNKRRAKVPKEHTVPRTKKPIQKEEIRNKIEDLVSKLFENPGKKK